MDYLLRGIPQQAVESLWGFAEPFIKRALDHTFGEVSAEDMKRMCLSRDMQLWMVLRENRVCGAGTTMIIDHPQMKVCRIVALAGAEFKLWKDVAHMSIEVWAAEQGCVAVECYVRRGFIPALQEIGYKHQYSVAHKSLKG